MEAETFQEVLDSEYARVEAIDAARDLFDQVRSSGAITVILLSARDEAVGAMHDLVDADPEDAKAVRALQWKVKRYDDLCGWIRSIIERGREATEDLTEEQAADLEKLIRGDEAELKDA
jgi:hypothetical protein